MYKVIASGSKGNAVLYHNSILVDCGVPFEALRPYLSGIQIVLLTHQHNDHVNINTLSRLAFERPALRVGCCDWMLPIIAGVVRNIDVFEIGIEYNYGTFQITPVKLYHDVPNCGYRIFANGKKILHATDTAHLDGITAKDYDLYALEHNYDNDTIQESIEAVEAAGGFAYQKGAINSHLSEQQAREFIYRNRCEDSKVVRLHQHV
jgi:L-ascorbate metabolism protein UlaG (beta-lactamase superfamily)